MTTRGVAELYMFYGLAWLGFAAPAQAVCPPTSASRSELLTGLGQRPESKNLLETSRDPRRALRPLGL